MCVRACVCKYACVYVCMRAYVCVRVCVCACVRTRDRVQVRVKYYDSGKFIDNICVVLYIIEMCMT